MTVPRFVIADFDKTTSNQLPSSIAYRDSPDITREDVVASLMQRLEIAPIVETGKPQSQSIDAANENAITHNAIALDFFALGYAWLQVRLMTLHVRYSTNLDNDVFDSALISAASAWSQNDLETASEHLTRCFDLLMEEKNNYYSVDPELIDLVLIEPSTVNSKLDSQLSCGHPINV